MTDAPKTCPKCHRLPDSCGCTFTLDVTPDRAERVCPKLADWILDIQEHWGKTIIGDSNDPNRDVEDAVMSQLSAAEARVKVLEGALKPFAEAAEKICDGWSNERRTATLTDCGILVGDLRRAHAALLSKLEGK